MSNFEIFLIVLAGAIPIIAILFVLPKVKKKEKKEPEKPTKTLEEVKREEKKPEIPKQVITKKEDKSSEISTADIQSYVDYKKKNITSPQKIQMPGDFKDVTMPYMPRRKPTKPKPKNVAEELRSLSPELKALIIAGVLDKKNYD